jgi:hypothetical protein
MAGGSMGTSVIETDIGNPINSETSHSKYLSISGHLGYFLRDNLVIGLAPGYGHNSLHRNSNLNVSSNLEAHQNIYGLDPFIRKYKQLFDSRVYLFGQASIVLSYNNTWQKYSYAFSTGDNRYSFKENVEGISLSPGINYFISNRIALEVIFSGLGLLTSKYKADYAGNPYFPFHARQYSAYFNLNLASVNLGLQFFLGKKRGSS